MDWIDKFMEYTDGIPSPEIFRLWSGIAAVAGALERRVYVRTIGHHLFPNSYVLLVARPGIGKTQAINHIKDYWRSTKKLFLAPNSVTKASLLDTMNNAKQIILTGSQSIPLEYHSLCIAAGEFGNLVPSHDTEFLNVMNDIYDNPGNYSETRRTGNVKTLDILNPQINLIAGVQPGFLAEVMPEQAWTMGFMSRMVMIHASTGPEIDIFAEPPEKGKTFQALADRMLEMTTLWGQMSFSKEMIEGYNAWKKEKFAPVPSHPKLAHYNTRRPAHILKLAMISSASRGNDLIISLEDFTRAKDWLFQAEHFMPDVFREMVGKSDQAILQEVHLYVVQEFARTKNPIPEALIRAFIGERTTVDKVEHIFSHAEKTGLFTRSAGEGKYVPRPRFAG